MPELNIKNAKVGDYTFGVGDWSVKPRYTDSAGHQKETEWTNSMWPIYLGHFKTNSDFQSSIKLLSTWITGSGWTADDRTTIILNNISGWGKETFDDIITSMEITANIGGDAYCEIIRENNIIVNLKPLDPGSMRHVVNRAGLIKRYEQFTKTPKGEKGVIPFKPEEIFHLVTTRLADEIHGLQQTEALQKTLTALSEHFDDTKKLMHRQVRPLILWKLKTDDTTAIKEFVNKVESAKKLGEDLFIPDDENAVTYEIVFVPANAMQSPFQWRDMLRNDFYRTIGLPQIIPGGGSDSTESHSKVVYLAFEQLVRARHLYLERQIRTQLGLNIKFNHPASLETGLRGDEAKDAGQGLEFQRGDTSAEVAR